MNLGIIGCGRISYKHVQAAIDNNDKIRLVAVCDIVRERAMQRAEDYTQKTKYYPSIFTDYKEMLEKTDCDLVAICTESGYHPEIALYCINRGIHVIVEKPMALSTADADRMIQAAKENHVKLCVCHQNRFNPPIQMLRKALEDGRFGRLIAGTARVLWYRGKNYYKQAPWRGTYELDGGCLMNQCIHNIDLLQWMLGEDVKWVHGDTGNYIHPYIEAEDYGSIQIKFNNGAVGNVEGTVCTCLENLEETLTIIGEKGTVSIGGLAVNKIEIWRFADNIDSEEDVIAKCNRDIDTVYGSGHTPLYKDMIAAIEKDQEPYINGQAGKLAMEIILAAYKSAKEGKRIIFPAGDIKTLDFK